MLKLSLQLEPNADGRYVFLAGQSIKGIIKLSLDTPKKFRALYIAIRGRSEIHWTETHHERLRDNARTVTENFQNSEIYLDSKTVLFGKIGGSSIEVPTGLHQYSFCCSLPPLLPYSIKAKHGKIEYSVETVLDVPWRFNKHCSVPFIVARYDDLNLRNDLKFGQISEDLKTFCCCLCSSQPLVLKASVPVLGFAIGQNVPIDIEYSNQSDVDVIRTEIKLEKFTKFISATPKVKTKLIQETVLETFTDGVAKKSSIKFQCGLKLPTAMHTSNDHCTRILQISYELQITAKVSGMHVDLSVTIPITIGTSPIILAPENAIRSDYFVQPSAPVYDENLDHAASFYEWNDQVTSDQPPPYSTIQSTYPINMHTQPANNFNQPHGSAFPTQNSFYPIQAQGNIQAVSNVQMPQPIVNSAQVLSNYPYSKNYMHI